MSNTRHHVVTMKISELIKTLEEFQSKNGDVETFYYTSGGYGLESITDVRLEKNATEQFCVLQWL